MEHHNLDIQPIPNGSEPLFINEPWIIDRSLQWLQETGFDPAPLPDADNIRVYLPMDICKSAVLRRLTDIIARYGATTEANPMTVAEIACATHHSTKTIRNYLNPEFSPLNGHYDLKRLGKLTPFEQDIISMRSNGQTYTEIYEFIKSKGYIGSVAAIRMFMQKERARAKRSGLHGRKDYIHRITLSQLVYRKLEDVKLITQGQYEALLKQYPELAALYGILREFHRIVFSKKAEDLEHWIEQASNLDTIPELKSFIDVLKHDISAVKNAIMFDYNNGLAEGSVTKIKLIKRIMYGRNSFTLLKAKVLMHELLYANSN